MKITFLGTRGYIKLQNKSHKMHTATIFSYKNKSVLVDFGENWIDKREILDGVDNIVLTHAHKDHAYGLEKGVFCPVYAKAATWGLIKHFPIEKKYRKVIKKQKPFKVSNMVFEPFEVEHSLLCPAIGFKITAGSIKVFYVPDVLWIKNREEAFSDISVYIGDGATISRNMVRRDKKSNKIFGHANIKTQLTWCNKESVEKMIVTHCGSDIVKIGDRKAKEKIQKLADEKGVEVTIAYDAMEVILR